jgi:preprotein translocase subunit SecD
MKTILSLVLLVTIVACSEKQLTSEYAKFELRLAQTEPDSNLTEMVFYNSNKSFFVHDSVYLTNDDIVSAEVIDRNTQPKVQVILTEEGKEKFAQFTGRYIGQNAAMIVDNKLMSAPRINAQITKGVLQIVGFFDQKEAQKISDGIVHNK